MKRNNLYAQLAIIKKQANIDDDSYRAILKRHGAALKNDKYSATTMSDAQLKSALNEIKKKIATKKDWRTPRINKIRVLWKKLADAGVVRDSSEIAMQHWVLRQCGVERLNFATASRLNLCIEGLKAWCDREGVKH